MGVLATQDMEKAEILGDGFTLIFAGTGSAHTAHTTEERQGLGEWRTTSCGRNQVWDQLKNLKVHKLMGTEIHPQFLRELVDDVAEPLPIVSQELGESSNGPTDGKAGWPVSPLCWATSWSRALGNYAEACGKLGDDWWQSTWSCDQWLRSISKWSPVPDPTKAIVLKQLLWLRKLTNSLEALREFDIFSHSYTLP